MESTGKNVRMGCFGLYTNLKGALKTKAKQSVRDKVKKREKTKSRDVNRGEAKSSLGV